MDNGKWINEHEMIIVCSFWFLILFALFIIANSIGSEPLEMEIELIIRAYSSNEAENEVVLLIVAPLVAAFCVRLHACAAEQNTSKYNATRNGPCSNFRAQHIAIE